MKEKKTHIETAENTRRPRRRRICRRLTKTLLWIAGVWAAVLLILQLALSPSVLGGIAARLAPEYIDGDLKFEKIKVNMFRHFPNVGISIRNGSLTYPADRFDSLETAGVQGLLMYHGCGEEADTLASFRHFSVSVNVASLISGKIKIPHIALVKPRIFAHSYDAENANWNIFKAGNTEDEDSVSTDMAIPHISVGRIRLVEHPHIVYTDCADTVFAMIDVKKIAFDGRLDTRRSSKNRIGLSFDSMMVAGRIAADTVGLGLDRLHIHEHNDHMDIHAGAKALLATRSFGRMHIPIHIKGTAAFPKDTVPTIVMNGFKAEIAAIPIGFDMTMRRTGGQMDVDGRFRVDGCRVEDMIDGFLKNIIPETAKVSTDASISLSGTCRGRLGNGELPDINAELTIPESSLSHKDIRHDIRLALGAGVNTDSRKRINVSISKASLSTYGLNAEALGGVSDLLGDDPLINIGGKFRASADSLLTFLPEDSGITAVGELAAELDGAIRMSQLDIYNFGKAELKGKVESGHLSISSPKDTIGINIDGLAVGIGPETKTSRRDTGATFRLLALNGTIGKADISIKEAFTVKTEKLDFAAKNSVDAMSGKDTARIHPLGGHLKAAELTIEDGAGMSLRLDETFNGFQMMPKRDNPKIPVLSLTSRNKRIYVRDNTNRIILTDAGVRGMAALNTIERRQKFRAFMDSLSLAHPEIPRDSLMPYLRSHRKVREIPEWMKEEDFKSGDLNFTLDGTLAEYFRKWDIRGDLDVRTGIIMTPHLPLRNIIRGMDISIDNNEVRIDSLKLRAGASEIAAKGSLSGLRRALLGRGAYNLDLVLSSDKMDANELLAALNAGAAADTEANAGKMENASDSEFLQMVVADSLDTDNISTLFIVPADLNATIRVDAGNISFSDLLINELKADVVMKERCMQIVNAEAGTNMGRADFEGFYATRNKKDIKSGFNLSLSDITSEKVIAMMPAIDTIMPLLKSFRGQLDCDLAATADLDTCMNIMTPTINGVIRIEGENLTLSDNEMFSSIAKKLKFKNRDQAKIDKMTVEGVIKDNTLEVFPFILELDRYTLAMSGLQRLDMSYKYHASIIRSPILFKIGVDIYGPDFDNMKFKIGKPKYRNKRIPVFSTVIDETRINLAESIRGIFEKGVELAVRENEMQKAITEHKQNIGYVNAAEQKLEELSAEEQKKFEEERERAESSTIDSLSISRTLNEIILKEITGDE